MGAVDDYLRGQITPRLQPGEHILGLGLVRKPFKINVLGVPQKYEEWLATSTNQRLILFRTEASGVLELTPQPLCLEVEEWWYQDLREITRDSVAGAGGGVYFGLVPHEGLGPRPGHGQRLDMFPKVHGLDGHAEFFAQYPSWLQQQVAAGAFPMTEARRAELAAIQEKARAEAADAEQKRAADAERRAQQLAAAGAAVRSRALPILGTVLLLAALGMLGTAGYFYFDRADSWRQMNKRDRASIKRINENLEDAKGAAKQDWEDELAKLEKGLKRNEEKISEYETLAIIVGPVGILALVGGVVVFVLWKKKKPA